MHARPDRASRTPAPVAQNSPTGVVGVDQTCYCTCMPQRQLLRSALAVAPQLQCKSRSTYAAGAHSPHNHSCCVRTPNVVVSLSRQSADKPSLPQPPDRVHCFAQQQLLGCCRCDGPFKPFCCKGSCKALGSYTPGTGQLGTNSNSGQAARPTTALAAACQGLSRPTEKRIATAKAKAGSPKACLHKQASARCAVRKP